LKRVRAAALLALAACAPSPDRAPPNLLLLSLDTLRADHLGCYGYPRGTSPHLDAVAAAGVLFEDVTSPSPWTLPAHASLLTGLYPSEHGVKEELMRLPPARPTLAERLAEAGYATRAIVNAHYVSARYGFGRGFEGFRYVSEWAGRRGVDRRVVNRAGPITDLALEWLSAPRERPFFLFLHYYTTHTPYAPAPAARERFVGPYAGAVRGETDELARLREEGALLSEADLRHLRDLYDAEIFELDAELSRLFAYLERSALARRTLVVVTSDHGEEFSDHGSLLHGRTHFQEVIRVPLLLHGAGLPAGRRVAAPVSLVDVTPTLLAAAGLPAPEDLPGLDLALYWGETRRAPRERWLFAEADRHNAAGLDVLRTVRRGSEKLTLDRASGRLAFYDLARDPGEREDLSARDPARVAALREHLPAPRAPASPPEALPPLSEEEREGLRALGYLE
jgi:arylsulfatase A-like enzyme